MENSELTPSSRRRPGSLRATFLAPAHPRDVETAGAGGDEHGAEQDSKRAAAADEREDDHRDAEPDQGQREQDADPAVHDVNHAALRPAATMTRHGAFLRTKSTVCPKIWRWRPRGAPRTTISAWRRSAS